MFDIQKMLKQAQKMQEQMKSVQTEMENQEFTGSAGNGAVSVTCNGKYHFTRVSLKPDAMADKDMLEDLVLTAIRDATNQVTKTMEDKMGKVTSGLNIPGMGNLLGM
ncbi:MAG: YbaB/EbfC family nucleoid-associated protein [Candidatus Melainabacteria bacterium]